MKLGYTDRLLHYQGNSVNRSSENGSSVSVLPSNVSTTSGPPLAEHAEGRGTLSIGKGEFSLASVSAAKPVVDLVKSQGRKYDTGKAPVQQAFLDYFPRAIAAVANVSAFGAQKYKVAYSDQDWRKVDEAEDRYRDAKGRHATPPMGELYAEDSKLLHAAHEAWNAMAVLELMLTRGVKERNDNTRGS